MEVEDAETRLEMALRVALGLVNALQVAHKAVVREGLVGRDRLLHHHAGAIDLQNQVVIPDARKHKRRALNGRTPRTKYQMSQLVFHGLLLQLKLLESLEGGSRGTNTRIDLNRKNICMV